MGAFGLGEQYALLGALGKLREHGIDAASRVCMCVRVCVCWQVRKIDKELSILLHNLEPGQLPAEIEERIGGLLVERNNETRPVFIRISPTDHST